MNTTALPSFVDGRRVDCSGERFTRLDPSSGEVLAQMHKARPSDVDAAMASAQRGCAAWSAMPVWQRARILVRAAALMRERAAALAMIEAQETGQPVAVVLKASVLAGAEALENFANAASLLFEASGRDGAGVRTIHRARGVCVGVGASLRSAHAACRQIAPALAAGNAVVFKAAEQAPAAVVHLAEWLAEAGLPAGVFNVLHGQRGSTGIVLGHRDAALALDAGSVADDAAPARPSIVVVFDDADIDAACDAAVAQGPAQVFVHRDLQDRLVAQLAGRVGRLRLGRPTDHTTEVGPMLDERQAAALLRHIVVRVETGATLVSGGHRVEVPAATGGAFVAPAVLVDATDPVDATPAPGPLWTVLPFESEAELVRCVNGGGGSASAAVFSRDTVRAVRVASALRTEAAWINRSAASSRADEHVAMQDDMATLRRFVRTTVLHTRSAAESWPPACSVLTAARAQPGLQASL